MPYPVRSRWNAKLRKGESFVTAKLVRDSCRKDMATTSILLVLLKEAKLMQHPSVCKGRDVFLQQLSSRLYVCRNHFGCTNW